jgi:histidyl-tRNA synthetase
MKISPLSGFPEWLPEQRLVEQALLDALRAQFELFGFAPLETRSVEPLEHLLAKGATDKEIYVLERLHAEPGEPSAGLGLHFDLTVPLARYVAQHRAQLVFPFRRYQIQKVWRGERPQQGRYREFYQADIDVIGQEHLPLAHDADLALALHAVLGALPLPRLTLRVNNRKILEGLYRGLGVEDHVAVLRTVDKLDKIGRDALGRLLAQEHGLSAEVTDTILRSGDIRTPDTGFASATRALGVNHPLLDEGIAELTSVMSACAHLPAGAVLADLHIARGLDYYTGTVYEGTLEGWENLGAVCSGGRYDDLAAMGGKQRLPGVGVSIGVSRILGKAFAEGLLRPSRKTPTAVLIALDDEERRPIALAVATTLRARGVACEVFDRPAKYGKQIQLADKRGIPYVWFCGRDGAPDEVRDLARGEQLPVDAASWDPAPEHLRVRIERA